MVLADAGNGTTMVLAMVQQWWWQTRCPVCARQIHLRVTGNWNWQRKTREACFALYVGVQYSVFLDLYVFVWIWSTNMWMLDKNITITVLSVLFTWIFGTFVELQWKETVGECLVNFSDHCNNYSSNVTRVTIITKHNLLKVMIKNW